MTPRAIAAIALLVLGVGIELACCVGVLVMRGVYDKLHYTAPASTLGAFAIAGAVLLRESIVQYGLKTILITLALLITNPVLTHAIARASRIRRFGAWTVQGGEEDEVVEIDVERR
jgi:monovalent cation/proton antiporter MnhG/PhaG subunit